MSPGALRLANLLRRTATIFRAAQLFEPRGRGGGGGGPTGVGVARRGQVPPQRGVVPLPPAGARVPAARRAPALPQLLPGAAGQLLGVSGGGASAGGLSPAAREGVCVS